MSSIMISRFPTSFEDGAWISILRQPTSLLFLMETLLIYIENSDRKVQKVDQTTVTHTAARWSWGWVAVTNEVKAGTKFKAPLSFAKCLHGCCKEQHVLILTLSGHIRVELSWVDVYFQDISDQRFPPPRIPSRYMAECSVLCSASTVDELCRRLNPSTQCTRNSLSGWRFT